MIELLDFILSEEDAFKSKARLASLYSDFSVLKFSNPDGYAANTAAWRSALEKASRAGLTVGDGSVLVLKTGPGLVRVLETKSVGRPLALGSVVNDAVASGTMIPLKDFMNAQHSIYKRSWMTLPTLSGVARWILGQIGLGAGGATSSGALAQGDFVVMKNLEETSTRILQQVYATATTATSLIYSLPTFTAAFSTILHDTKSAHNPTLTAADIDLLLRHLSRDRSSLTYTTSPTTGVTTIKFSAPGSITPPAPINEQDTTIATLDGLIHNLSLQISTLTVRITALDAEARTALASSNRPRALHALRSKKATETLLQKREDSLAQLEKTLSSIDEAAGQVEMLAAMEASSRVLRELNAKVGGVEGVERVREGLDEQTIVVDEVSGVLTEPGVEGVDEGEVDEELERLVGEEAGKEREKQEEKEGKEVQMAVSQSPSVPTTVVGESVEERREEHKDTAREEEEDGDLERSLEDLSLKTVPKQPVEES